MILIIGLYDFFNEIATGLADPQWLQGGGQVLDTGYLLVRLFRSLARERAPRAREGAARIARGACEETSTAMGYPGSNGGGPERAKTRMRPYRRPLAIWTSISTDKGLFARGESERRTSSRTEWRSSGDN